MTLLKPTRTISELVSAADEEFDKGEWVAGSALMWQAAEQAMLDLARQLDLPPDREHDMLNFIKRLDAEYGYNWKLISNYQIAMIFKENSEHDFMEDYDIETCRELIVKFFEYITERIPAQQR